MRYEYTSHEETTFICPVLTQNYSLGLLALQSGAHIIAPHRDFHPNPTQYIQPKKPNHHIAQEQKKGQTVDWSDGQFFMAMEW